MSANETFLEKFIDNIGTIPLEIRRNLAHMRSLDENYLSLHQHLRDSEEEYLKRAHDIISVLPVQSRKKNKATEDHARHDGGNCSTAGGDIDGVDASIRMNSANDGNLSTSESSSSQDSERNEWIKHKEGIIVKIPSLPVTENANENMNTKSAAEAESGSIATSDEDKEHTNKCVTNSQGIDIDIDVDINTDTDNTKSKTMLVVPTTEELRQQIQDPHALLQIAILRRNARELVEEKSSNANQTYTIIDDIIKRLDDDIEQFETLLRTTGQYVSETAVVGTGGPQPNDLAAIQVTPNSPDWILAKVMSHDEETGVYNLSDEDIESSKTFLLPESQVVILGGVDRLNRGDVIYGVYPDTTSFYQATAVEMPKKVPGKDVLVLVHFKDDGDEHGITHAKAVPMKHVMKVPYGAIQ